LEVPDIVRLIAEGNESAFRTLVNEHADRVYNTCLGMLQHAEDAEDITQEVFIEVHRSIGKFRGECGLGTWLYRIAVSKSLDLLKNRRTAKRFAFITSLFGDEGVHPIADTPHFDHPGVQLENKEHARVLFHALHKLPESQRTAFTLNQVEGLSYLQISEVMETSVASVDSLMVRARKNLRKLLKGYYDRI
jgi:RNA polymerase sigma-70 factor (ECF subfamily)